MTPGPAETEVRPARCLLRSEVAMGEPTVNRPTTRQPELGVPTRAALERARHHCGRLFEDVDQWLQAIRDLRSLDLCVDGGLV